MEALICKNFSSYLSNPKMAGEIENRGPCLAPLLLKLLYGAMVTRCLDNPKTRYWTPEVNRTFRL